MGLNTSRRASVRSDINITPLIDVILVLLIIFLVTMPMMMQQITIEVPRSLDGPSEWNDSSETIVVSVQADGDIELSIGGSREQVPLSTLAARLTESLDDRVGRPVVFVDFDYAIRYDDVIRVMDVVSSREGVQIAVLDKDALREMP